MKRSPKAHSLINDNGQFCGVELTPLYAAEQECGIQPIEAAFGIDPLPSKPNYQRYRISQCPDKLRDATSPADAILMFSTWVDHEFRYSKRSRPVIKDTSFPTGLSVNPNERLNGAWRDCAFGIYAAGRGIEDLLSLRAAFERLDVAIFLKGTHSASFCPSLCIMIASATPRSFWPGEPEPEVLPHWL